MTAYPPHPSPVRHSRYPCWQVRSHSKWYGLDVSITSCSLASAACTRRSRTRCICALGDPMADMVHLGNEKKLPMRPYLRQAFLESRTQAKSELVKGLLDLEELYQFSPTQPSDLCTRIFMRKSLSQITIPRCVVLTIPVSRNQRMVPSPYPQITRTPCAFRPPPSVIEHHLDSVVVTVSTAARHLHGEHGARREGDHAVRRVLHPGFG